MYQDYFAGSSLLVWPLVGLLLFVASFAAVLFYVIVGLRDRRSLEHLAGLPLDSGESSPTVAASAADGDAEGKVS
jgi:hypothetical protein